MRNTSRRKPESTGKKPSSRRLPAAVRKLLPLLRSLEHERLSRLNKVKIAYVVIGLIGASAFILFLQAPGATKYPLVPFFFVAFWTLLFMLLAKGSAIAGLKNPFKDKLLTRVVEGYNPNLTYSKECTLTSELFNESMLFENQAAHFWGEDMITGAIGDTRIRLAEVTALETKKDSEGKEFPVRIVFRGLFYELDFNKRFNGMTFVVPDTEEAAFGKTLGQWIQSRNECNGELVKLEDPEFERHFAVYGTDQIEARYILSPSLMRRITEYRKKAGRPLRMSFRNGKVYVAIPAPGDFLELNLDQSLLKRGIFEKHLEDLDLALGIVEDLNLNRRIWQS